MTKARITAFMCLAAGLGLTPVFAQNQTKSLDVKGLDKTISPKQDFYHHVNSKWQKDHPLTAEYSRYGQFNILNDSSENRVQRIVKGLAATNPAKGLTLSRLPLSMNRGWTLCGATAKGQLPSKRNSPKSRMPSLRR